MTHLAKPAIERADPEVVLRELRAIGTILFHSAREVPEPERNLLNWCSNQIGEKAGALWSSIYGEGARNEE